MSDLTFAEWPEDRSRPTPEEWAAAEIRFRADNTALRQQLIDESKPPYMGDCGYSLAFDMATCSRSCWWHYFFPDERLDLYCDLGKR